MSTSNTAPVLRAETLVPQYAAPFGKKVGPVTSSGEETHPTALSPISPTARTSPKAKKQQQTCPIQGGPLGPQLKWNWNYS